MPEAPTTANAAMAVAASALRAQQARMKIIAENIANADSTATTAGGDPYRRQAPVLEPKKLPIGVMGVAMTGARDDTSEFKSEYDPGNPAADANGYVRMPNVDTMIEALDMRSAQRAYEASLNVIETARSIQTRTLDILKK